VSALWTAAEAAAATGGTPAGPDWTATGVSIDSRSILPGELFVALADARDGHAFVADALAKGAAAALVARVPEGIPADAPLLLVPDVLDGLRALARAARARFAGRVIAVTGSVGKTGTKEMLRTALGAQGRVSVAEKSFNNHWGVPLTLARLDPRADWAVIEIGMNAPGEIAPLAALARPHVAIVTTVEPVHLEAFGRIEGIAREKASIFGGLEPGGAAVMNRDVATYPILAAAARRAGARPIRFGTGGRPEARLLEVQVGGASTTVSARIHGRPVLFKIGAPGRHLAMNALAALAAAEAAGGDLARAALALARWQPPQGRGSRWEVALGPEGRDGVLGLIDESYNANPAAMAAAFEVFATAPLPGAHPAARPPRRVAFLGDMLELGSGEAAMHAALASLPTLATVTTVHCAGPRMKALHAALPAGRRGEWHETAEALAARARHLVGPGDLAMVKGSNGSRISKVVEALKTLGATRPAAPAGD
jgi:UDP-N-acetylmuramoyl-tripeptide--D-alanyl-D-alanine ligase